MDHRQSLARLLVQSDHRRVPWGLRARSWGHRVQSAAIRVSHRYLLNPDIFPAELQNHGPDQLKKIPLSIFSSMRLKVKPVD